MLKIESIYFPFVNLIFGTIAGVLLTHLVNTNLGKWSYVLSVLATLGVCSLWRDGWNFFTGCAYIDALPTPTTRLLASTNPRYWILNALATRTS